MRIAEADFARRDGWPDVAGLPPKSWPPRHRLGALALAALWWLVGAGQFAEVLGPRTAASLLPILGALGIVYVWASGRTRIPWLVSVRPSHIMVAAAAGAVLAFAALYAPRSADAVSVLDRAVAALLAGQSPYGAAAALGHPILALPGVFLLALPFHALGTAALQNPFWLGAFFLHLARRFPDARSAALFALLILANPGVLRDYVIGNDYLTDVIVLFFSVELVFARNRRDASIIGQLVAWACLAVALSTHPIFWVTLPILALHAWRQIDRTAALIFIAAEGALLVALSVSFYAADPTHFTPLLLVEGVLHLPHLFLILPLLSILSAGLLLRTPPRLESVMAVIAAALAILLLPPLLWHVAGQGLTYYTVFALPVLLFLSLGWLTCTAAPTTLGTG